MLVALFLSERDGNSKLALLYSFVLLGNLLLMSFKFSSACDSPFNQNSFSSKLSRAEGGRFELLGSAFRLVPFLVEADGDT